jgi:hypothetical protein
MHNASPSTARLANTEPWYKHVWPWLLMLGPVAVILAGSYTTWLAFTKPDAMVVDDYYTQGKAINQDLRRDRIATGLGLSFSARYNPAGGQLNGTLLGFGQPVAGKIIIRLAHATLPEKDIRLEARPDQSGAFSAGLPMLERGRWQVVIEGERRDWRLTGRWEWPSQKRLDIKADMPSAG